MPKIKPNKKELSQFKVMSGLGLTPNAIGVKTGRDPKTVRKWLKSDVYQDPEIQQMIDTIKGKELEQLTLIGGKARTILDKYLNDCLEGNKEPNPISVTAILDRTFQQKRLLENKSTDNLSIRDMEAHLSNRLKELEEIEDSLLHDIDSQPPLAKG